MSGDTPRRADDGGFTLPELIISMTILSFIMGALVFALVFALRSSSTTAERVLAGGNQTLAAWFPSDVMSAAPDQVSTDPSAVTACQGETGDLVLLLPRAGDATTAVSYRTVADGSTSQLWRFVCTGGTSLRHNIVVQGISDPATTHADVEGAPTVTRVTLTVVTGTKEPTTLTVVGSPRTPDQPVPCSLVAATPQTLVIDAGGRPSSPVTFRITTAGECVGDLHLHLPTSDATAIDPQLAGADGSWSATVDAGDGSWTATAPGTPRSAAVELDGRAIGEFPLDVVTQPCAVLSATATPVHDGAITFEADGHLTDVVSLAVVTSGPCVAPMQASLATGGTPATLTVALTRAGGAWRGTVTKGVATWSAGLQAGNVTSAGASAGSIGVLVEPGPCRLANDPSRTIDTDVTGQVTGRVTLSLTTTGVCKPAPNVTISVPTGGAPDPFVAALVGGPNAWTVDIPRCTGLGSPPCTASKPPGPTWADGPHTVTISDGTTPIDDTFVLTAREVCSMIGNGPSTPILLANDLLRSSVDLTVTTRGNCGALTLAVDTGVAPGLAGLPLTGTAGAYKVTVAKADAHWTVGAHVVTVSNDGTVLGTYTVTTVATCAVVDNSWSPTIGVSGANRVTGNQRITFTTSGPCGTSLTVVFDPPGQGALQTVTATPTVPNGTTWQTTNLQGTPWTRGQSSQVFVHTGPPLDGTTVAGIFDVVGQ